jgi:putative oxidoreductase
MNFASDAHQAAAALASAGVGWQVPLLARILLVWLFPFSAIDKMLHWQNAIDQARSSVLPPSWAPAMLVCAMAAELVLPVCIVAGWFAPESALVLAAYCVATALLFHRFWTYGDFWKKHGTSEARSHFWDFLKNFGLAGGLLLIAIGRGF